MYHALVKRKRQFMPKTQTKNSGSCWFWWIAL